MAASLPDLWMTAQELADAGLPQVPASKRLVNRMAEAEGWRDRGGMSRMRRGGRGGAVEYHVSVLPQPALRALTARALVKTGTQAVVAVEAAILFWTEGRGTKSAAVAEAARISGASQTKIWGWWRLVEGMTPEQRHAALNPVNAAVEAETLTVEAKRRSGATAQEAGLAGFDQLSAKQQRVAEARAAILRAVDGVAKTRGIGLTEARSAFAEGWAEGDDFELGDVRSSVPKISPRSLKRWSADFRKGGLASLADGRGAHMSGSGVIDGDADIRVLVEGMLASFSEVQITTVHEAIKARFKGRKIPSKRTVQRWVSAWKQTNAAAFLLVSDPDAYKNRAKLVVGNASESVLRLNQLWQMDGTPNDVMLSDGNRHAIIGVLDVYSRRMRLLVTKTQTAAAVAACLRKALLEWGVPEEIKMDNGSDYRSKHIARVCTGLGIEQDFCPAFSPEKKPHIERAFRTFSHDLVTLQAGFIGHSVEQRKKIEARKTFASRLMDRDAAAPDLNMTADELQLFCDRWCKSVYENRSHGSLGCTPFEKAQSWRAPVRMIENERALDTLLMPAPSDNGTRTVTKYGVQIENFRYVDPALQAHWSQRVQVRLDEEDWGRVLVLTEAGEFIAWAICPERSGVSRAEAAAYFASDRKKIEQGFRQKMAKAKRDSQASTVSADILASYEDAAEKVVAFPTASEPYTTNALDSAAEAASQRGKADLVEKRTGVSADDLAKLKVASVTPIKRKAEQPKERFRRWEAVDVRVRDGEAIGESEAKFWRAYPTSPEHAALVGQIEDYGRERILGPEDTGPASSGDAG